jgi:hypothetical protein
MKSKKLEGLIAFVILLLCLTSCGKNEEIKERSEVVTTHEALTSLGLTNTINCNDTFTQCVNNKRRCLVVNHSKYNVGINCWDANAAEKQASEQEGATEADGKNHYPPIN